MAQEGSQALIPFLGPDRIIHPTLSDLRVLLAVTDSDLPPSLDQVHKDTKDALEKLPTGPIALNYQGKSEDGIDIRLDLVGWKGRHSVRAYVPKNERMHHLRLVGGDLSKYEKNKFEEKRQMQLYVAQQEAIKAMQQQQQQQPQEQQQQQQQQEGEQWFEHY